MSVSTAPVTVSRGLEGVVVAETSICDVNGQLGTYRYRQYDAIELAERLGLEEVWHLLFFGSLPTRQELDQFLGQLRSLRQLPYQLSGPVIRAAAAGAGDPMHAVRSATSLLAQTMDFGPATESDPQELRKQTIQISALLPTLVAAVHRLRNGLQPIDPDPALPQAANFLYMLDGRVPPASNARKLEQYMIITADHGMGAATFAARVITSTGADVGSAVTGALGAFAGPLHGGAPSRVLDMLDSIGARDRVDPYLRDLISQGGRVMGFGHRVYKTRDPRALMLQRLVEELGCERLEFARHVELRALELLAELKPASRLCTNVEFYAALLLEEVGIPRELFTATFAAGRIAGWSAHILEQAAENRLIRPSTLFLGSDLERVPQGGRSQP